MMILAPYYFEKSLSSGAAFLVDQQAGSHPLLRLIVRYFDFTSLGAFDQLD
jgi:hypothetical protein